ncbi:MAG: hypothetical protein P8Z00_21630 [Anaerolineales bacterium]
MHISIFVFAGLSLLRVDGIGLYYLLILYFFPFGSLKNFFSNRRPVAVPGVAVK